MATKLQSTYLCGPHRTLCWIYDLSSLHSGQHIGTLLTLCFLFLFFHLTQGISSHVDKPSQASSYVEPLLDFAAQHIPKHKHMETPLYILATAGMRMLPPTDQEAILEDLRVDIPLKCNFHFTSSHVEVITGKQEGMYVVGKIGSQVKSVFNLG